MKKVYQNHLRKMLIAIYQPVITRIELFRSTRMWQKGVKATLAKYKEGGAPRFYMLYDQSHKDWAIMTYDPNRKGMLAYRRLVQLGKWKATRYFKNVEDIKLHPSTTHLPSGVPSAAMPTTRLEPRS
jgi:hypothetical protein